MASFLFILAGSLVSCSVSILLLGRKGTRGFHRAAAKGHFQLVADMIRRDRTIVKKRDLLGVSALQYAARNGQNEISMLLVRGGADPSEGGGLSWNPLQWAIIANNSQLFEFLLNAGVEPNARGWFSKRTALHTAFCMKRYDMARRLLNLGADPNGQDYAGHAPLHAAAYDNEVAIAQYLLENGALANLRGQFGNTPLHYAAMRKNSEMVELLLHFGADPSTRNWFGFTPGFFWRASCEEGPEQPSSPLL
jgi:ankyrin repeat protein